MNAFLIYTKFIDEITKEPSIGGIQTYISDLANVFISKHYNVIICQSSKNSSLFFVKNYTIQNIHTHSNRKNEYISKLKEYLDNNCTDNDFIVFMTHTLNFKYKHKKTVSIQHGIIWDVENEKSKIFPIFEYIIKCYRGWYDIKTVNFVKNTVAVDYNFPNWYRSHLYNNKTNIHVITNYCSVLSQNKPVRNSTIIKIIFARRFEKYRGTRLFAEVIDKLINDKLNIEITFAGSGSDEGWLKNKYSSCRYINFIKYKSNDSIRINSQYDISVNASIGSEGTSLSVLEAMASKCAIVTTNVGGLSNIIINGFNGIMCDATVDSIYSGLKRVIIDGNLRDRISNNAYEVVKYAFNRNRWENEWVSEIERIENN